MATTLSQEDYNRALYIIQKRQEYNEEYYQKRKENKENKEEPTKPKGRKPTKDINVNYASKKRITNWRIKSIN